ncbi:MAG: transporter substrate-binding domain-containing protein [Paracoccaceae bacterium]
MRKLLFLITLLSGLVAHIAAAQTLTVSTVTRPPFSMLDEDTDTGFSMELLRALATDLGWEIEVKRHEIFGEMLNAVETGASDLAIANISITAAREQVMDFSQPIFESGLQIMVPAQSTRSPSLFRALMSTDLLLAIGLAFLVLFCGGMLMWFFERRAQPYFDRPASEAMFPAFWWALNLVVNGGFEERVPRTVFGRFFAVILVISSLFIVSVFVAKITSVMTVEAISGQVNTISDLYGQRVATIEGSTAAGFLERREVDFRGYSDLDSMLRDFEDGQFDAVVFDSPILSYYAAHQGRDFASMAGAAFLRENYGIVFPAGSPLVEDVNRALLSLRETGTYDTIYRRWFGAIN